jgi:hypothetical protein
MFTNHTSNASEKYSLINAESNQIAVCAGRRMFNSVTASFGPILEPPHSSAEYFVLAKKQGIEVLLCVLMFLCVKMRFAVGLCQLLYTVSEKVN